MKIRAEVIAILMTFLFLAIGPVFAMDMDHSSHGTEMKTTDKMDTMDAMDDKDSMMQSNHKGELVRETTVEGYHLAYHLIDMQAQMKQMKAAGHTHPMNNTHHLMVYITDEAGSAVTDAKVGYLIQTTKDKNQKAMAMGMAGGYGADVDLSSPGTYAIKTKIVVGKKTFMDKFDYMRH